MRVMGVCRIFIGFVVDLVMRRNHINIIVSDKGDDLVDESIKRFEVDLGWKGKWPALTATVRGTGRLGHHTIVRRHSECLKDADAQCYDVSIMQMTGGNDSSCRGKSIGVVSIVQGSQQFISSCNKSKFSNTACQALPMGFGVEISTSFLGSCGQKPP